jgi:RNA polymerase sigma factor (sigma-70 family)
MNTLNYRTAGFLLPTESRQAEASAVAGYENMIAFIAKTFPVSVVLGWGDLMQHGRIGALKAYRSFDADRGASPASWFYLRIRSEMTDAARALNHVRSRARGGEISGHGSSVREFVEATSAIPSGEDFRKEVETRMDASTLMNTIEASSSATIMQHLFFDALTAEQCGARIGVSPVRIDRIKRATLAAIRQAAAAPHPITPANASSVTLPTCSGSLAKRRRSTRTQ